MKYLWWIIFVTAAVIGYWYWDNVQDEVISYNDGVIDLIDEAHQHYDGYLFHLNKYHDGEVVDIEQMRDALDLLYTGHRDIVAKLGQLDIPDFEECNLFHQAFAQYLDNFSEIIATYDVITNHIESHNPGREDDIAVIDAALNDLLVKHDELLSGIRHTQERMAEKFRFGLE